MYDKINFWMPRYRDTPDISRYLDNGKIQADIRTGETCLYGSVGGLKISSYLGGISIIGSLPKFYYPNNIYPLDRNSTAQAIEKLSDTLHLNVREARVTGLEFGKVFILEHPIKDYLTRLGDMPRHIRCPSDAGTLYYTLRASNPDRVISFYDKKADAIAKGMILPPGFENTNLLKYEIRYRRHLCRQLRVPEMVGATLYAAGFYGQMAGRYKSIYFSIHKMKQERNSDIGGIKTVTDAYNVFVGRLISQGGQAQISAFMEELKEARVFEDNKNYSRLKKKMFSCHEKAGTPVPDALVNELDDEVKNAVAYI